MSDWAVVVAGVGGTLAGSIGTGAVTWWLEERRWKRSEQTRWLDDRRRLYARFLEAADEILTATSRLALETHAGAAMSVESMHRVAEADRALRAAFSEIELVGGAAEVDAARRLRAAVWDLSGANTAKPDDDDAERQTKLDAALSEWNSACDAFKQSARSSIQPGSS